MRLPEAVSLSESRILAIPKSVSFMIPRSSIMIFSGLMSLCMMFAWWA